MTGPLSIIRLFIFAIVVVVAVAELNVVPFRRCPIERNYILDIFFIYYPTTILKTIFNCMFMYERDGIQLLNSWRKDNLIALANSGAKNPMLQWWRVFYFCHL